MIMELSMRFEAGNSSAASLFLARPPRHSTALSFLDTYTKTITCPRCNNREGPLLNELFLSTTPMPDSSRR